MLTPYLPYPLISGGQIRSYNLLKNLARKHKITLIALIKQETEKQYIPQIAAFCTDVIVARRPEKPWTPGNILKTGFGKYPFLVVRNFSPRAKLAVIEQLNKHTFDLIHAETFYVMPHIPQTRIPVLLVEQTIEYLVYKHFVETLVPPLRWLFGIDVEKIRFWEEYYWQQAKRVVAMSRADKQVMLSRLPHLDVSIVPNGVDDQFFTFYKKTLRQKPTVLFVGNFKWLQNREAVSQLVKNIWPLISKSLPQARLLIVGKYPTSEIRDFAYDQIDVSDTVEDIREAYRKADVLLAPIFGPGGTRYKILEAMASGVPVVTTLQGIEGLGIKNGREALISTNPAELAQATVKILTQKHLHESLTLEANSLVRKAYSWKIIAATLDELYEKVAHENPQ